ncbi:MAG: hypothetical protein LPL29_13365 [Alphaproteobacteria bacterium]|nr:hypothetical protein [Alphaproteobacteria bacterium]
MASVLEEWGMCCPKCKRDDRLQIVALTSVNLTGEGTEEQGDHEWSGGSDCRCMHCRWAGPVRLAEIAGKAEIEKRKAVPPKKKYFCGTCGSEDVRKDAFAEWDFDKQEWVLHSFYDYAYCEDCEGETTLEETYP